MSLQIKSLLAFGTFLFINLSYASQPWCDNYNTCYYYNDSPKECVNGANCYAVNTQLRCETTANCFNIGPQKPYCDPAAGTCRQKLVSDFISDFTNDFMKSCHYTSDGQQISCEMVFKIE